MKRLVNLLTFVTLSIGFSTTVLADCWDPGFNVPVGEGRTVRRYTCKEGTLRHPECLNGYFFWVAPEVSPCIATTLNDTQTIYEIKGEEPNRLGKRLFCMTKIDFFAAKEVVETCAAPIEDTRSEEPAAAR